MRGKVRAAIMAPTGQPNDIAVSVNPATSAERFSTPCTYIGRKVVSPITAMPPSSVAELAEAIGRRAQSANATIGSAARRSCRTNRTVLTAQTAEATRTLRGRGAELGQRRHQRGDRDREQQRPPATSTRRALCAHPLVEEQDEPGRRRRSRPAR